MAQFLGEERSKFDVPLPQGLVADHDATLEQHFLDVSLAEWEAVVEPEGIPDDAQRETVAVGLPVTHGLSAYRG